MIDSHLIASGSVESVQVGLQVIAWHQSVRNRKTVHWSGGIEIDTLDDFEAVLADNTDNAILRVEGVGLAVLLVLLLNERLTESAE